MRSNNKPATRLADEFVARYPKMPNRTLARLMNQREPKVFPSIDTAESAVRYRRGRCGAKSRSYRDVQTVRQDSPNVESRAFVNRFELPETDIRPFLPFIIPSGRRRMGILSDLHIPYHDPAAVTAAIAHLQRERVDSVLLNGDLMDCHMLSRFEQDPRARDFKGEVDMTRRFLQSLQRALPGVSIFWKLGNHEERFDSYMRRHAPQLLGLDAFVFEKLFDGFNIQFIGNKRPIVFDKLTILHGHEYTARGFTNPVNPARSIFLRAKECVLVGHWHQKSEHSATAVNGRVIATWSTGCLCDLHPDYMPLNEWSHGFALVCRDQGKFRVSNLKIIDGEVV